MTSEHMRGASRRERVHEQAGQASIMLVVMLSLFLLAVLAFAVDYTNIWFQRQQTQTAADAACLAGIMDVYQVDSGVGLPSMNFAQGAAGNCNAFSNGGPSMCWYASKNGFNGYSGGTANVSWSFPSSVAGVITPPSTSVPFPFMQVSVTLPVKTYFSTLLTAQQTQQVGANATCGVTQIMEGAPIMILHPTMSGALAFSGNAVLAIVGGPPRSIVVNSSSATAALCGSSGVIDTTLGGPNLTGADVGTYGGPHAAPGPATGCTGSNHNTTLPPGFNGGSTGHWVWPATPIADPYAALGPPTSVRSITPITTTSGMRALHNIDGCPDTSARGCAEFGPGYYPNGIVPGAGNIIQGNDVVTFLPGVYYLNGDLQLAGTNTIRLAKPCADSQGNVGSSFCSTQTKTGGPSGAEWHWQQTDGVMFYFVGTGAPSIHGASGTGVYPRVDKVPANELTCDGSAPPSYLGLAVALDESVLVSQCTAKGTYYDAGGDTNDSVGTIRGLMMFMDHTDTSSPSLAGGGTLAYTGTFYFHSGSYATVFNITGGSTNGTLLWGNVVTDQMQLTGNGALTMALNPSATTPMLKVSLLQ